MLIVHLISLSRFTSVMHEIWIVGVPDIKATKLACQRQGVTNSTRFFTSFFLLDFEKTMQNIDWTRRKNILVYMFKAKFLALGIK
jgi:hypothetical protein